LGPESLEPIRATLPVLFVAGTLDGRTPLENLAELERRFPDHRTIIVENGGHNRLLDDDIRDGILAFLCGEPVAVTRVVRNVRFVPPVPFRYSLEDELDRALASGGADAARRLYFQLLARYGSSTGYDYDLSEAALNGLGYRLLGAGRLDDAVAIFELSVEEHPDSYNTWDSLGEAWMARGETAQAIAYYRKSLELNSFNGNAHGMLLRLGAAPASAAVRAM
jgi:tetratricopeptide (TPR) repeat protein